MSDKHLVAARVYDGLSLGSPDKSDVELLCTLVEADEGAPQNFEHFALDIEQVAWMQFCMSELLADSDIEESMVGDAHKLQFMRERLKYALLEPSEDVPSAHWAKIALTTGHELFACGLVTVETGGGVIEWYGAFLSVSDFYDALRKDGYLLCEKDLSSLSDERLLEIWDKYEE